MGYSNDFVKMVIASAASGRTLERDLRVSRKSVYRWRGNVQKGLPARQKRAPKKVWNRKPQSVIDTIVALLKQGLATIEAWIDVNKTSLRTVQRYKAKYIPPEPKIKVKVKRYERRKIGSLFHTDWGVKRILNGQRCCFSFYEDDATRKLYALHAYPRATLENTIDNLHRAKKAAPAFKALLTDNGCVYMKNFDAQLVGIKHIHTRVHNPKCNGKAEAVVKKVKKFVSKHTIQNIDHANELLTQFEKEYNNRPHSSLKYQTPNQRYRDKLKSGDICVVT
jgi:transposase InsO family protein